MSGMYEVWGSGSVWYATRWFGESPEGAGPFATKDEALTWAKGGNQ